MEDVSEIYLTSYEPTIYTSPCTLEYLQNGKPRKWDIFAERNGVVIIVYNSTRNVLVLVKQFRPSVYIQQVSEVDRMKHPIDTNKCAPELGVTIEFCAGLEDKNIPSEEIAREEILEECGYAIDVKQLEKVVTMKNLTETTGARSTFYYCEVTDDMKVHEGGGVEGENVQVVEIPVEEIITLASKPEVVCPINFMFGFYWFLSHKYNKTCCKCIE